MRNWDVHHDVVFQVLRFGAKESDVIVFRCIYYNFV